MAQLIFRIFYVKYSLIIDFVLVWFGIFVHQFLDFSTKIDFEKRKYDTVFFLTCLVLVSRIIINVSVMRDKKMLENESKRLDNAKKRLENERVALENEKLRKELNS